MKELRDLFTGRFQNQQLITMLSWLLLNLISCLLSKNILNDEDISTLTNTTKNAYISCKDS